MFYFIKILISTNQNAALQVNLIRIVKKSIKNLKWQSGKDVF